MELMEGLLTRRSIRKYQDKPIERETMMEIIKAAQYSPTAHNRQPWEFLVIDDREFLAELRHIQRWTSFAKDAACVVIVCGDTEKSFSRSKEDEKWTFIDVDCAIATENLMPYKPPVLIRLSRRLSAGLFSYLHEHQPFPRAAACPTH